MLRLIRAAVLKECDGSEAPVRNTLILQQLSRRGFAHKPNVEELLSPD